MKPFRIIVGLGAMVFLGTPAFACFAGLTLLGVDPDVAKATKPPLLAFFGRITEIEARQAADRRFNILVPSFSVRLDVLENVSGNLMGAVTVKLEGSCVALPDNVDQMIGMKLWMVANHGEDGQLYQVGGKRF